MKLVDFEENADLCEITPWKLFLLLEKKMDPNIQDNCKNTLLHSVIRESNNFAKKEENCTGDNYMYVDTLLQHKANPNVRTKCMMSAPLHIATEKNNIQAALLLLRAKANPNIQDYFGCTPLMSAKSKEMVQILLQHGANINMRDYFGWTALHHATRVEVITALIENGIDTTIPKPEPTPSSPNAIAMPLQCLLNTLNIHD